MEVPFHLLGENLLLNLIAMLEKLLNDVVAKHILHQLDGVGLDFVKDTFLFFAVGHDELVLNETRSVLIPAELDDVAINVLYSTISYHQIILIRLAPTCNSKRLFDLFTLRNWSRSALLVPGMTSLTPLGRKLGPIIFICVPYGAGGIEAR